MQLATERCACVLMTGLELTMGFQWAHRYVPRSRCVERAKLHPSKAVSWATLRKFWVSHVRARARSCVRYARSRAIAGDTARAAYCLLTNEHVLTYFGIKQ